MSDTFSVKITEQDLVLINTALEVLSMCDEQWLCGSSIKPFLRKRIKSCKALQENLEKQIDSFTMKEGDNE